MRHAGLTGKSVRAVDDLAFVAVDPFVETTAEVVFEEQRSVRDGGRQ